jgi:hypothetical protein
LTTRTTSRRTLRRSLAAAALAPLLLSGVAACGDDSGSDGSSASDSGSGSDSSGDGGAAAGSLVLADLDEGDEVSPDEFVSTVADGLESSTTAHMTMTMEMGGQTVTESQGDVDYTTDPPSMTMTMGGGVTGEMEMVMVDGVVYMKSDMLTSGKYWKIDPSDPDGAFGQMGFDKLLDQSDPAAALESMKDGISTVTFEGTEDVDGRELDHYAMTVDPSAMLDELGTDVPSEAAKGMPDAITYDLWLDDEDRFAQMQMDTEIMSQDMTMEMTVDDWGKDVSIEAPPAGEVTDMPDMDELMGQMGGGGA